MEEKIKTFLDEGYDFIDESFSDEPLEFVEANEEIIVESEGGTPHQYKILGRASGVFQSVGGFSRNNRRYLPEHWSVQLNKPLVKERLAQRDYMGTIGHHDHPVLDSEIAQGLVSHLLSKLEIREDKNGKPYLYGEIEILDTPAGRILKAMYEGGASIFVSSRAAGKLRPVPGQTYQEVDPINYHFEGFDVVRRAGFPVAKPVYEEVKNEPVIAKSVSESVKEEPVKQEISESTQSSNEEISQLKSQLDQLTKIIEKVVDDVYEEPTNEEQVVEEEVKEEHKLTSESLAQIASLLADSTISESSLVDILKLLIKKEDK